MSTPIDFKALAAPFPEEEIEWRIGQCGTKNQRVWAMCLAYVQARAIMNRLDDVCGPANWQITYQPSGNGFLAGLSIKVGEEWVTKWDGADQTDIESFKGGISSALKRAAVPWGIGRYLYKLEATFATIVDDRKGANWGKTKEGKEFYWIPPALPAWALPDPKKAKGNPQVRMTQPSPGDGAPNATFVFTMRVGQHARRNLPEIERLLGGLPQMVEWYESGEARADKKRAEGKMTEEEYKIWREDLDRVAQYIGQRELEMAKEEAPA